MVIKKNLLVLSEISSGKFLGLRKSIQQIFSVFESPQSAEQRFFKTLRRKSRKENNNRFFGFSLSALVSDFLNCIDGNRAKKTTKGQLKIQQMAFMLMAVTLFFVLAGMFVLVIKFSGLKESASLLEEENAILLVTKLANSPEFSCGEALGNVKTNCVDADKVMVLKDNIEKYNDFWGDGTNIEIRKIYPAGDVECSRANYPNCNIINLQSEKLSAEHSNFITLCRKESFDGDIYDKCELAKIMVEYNG